SLPPGLAEMEPGPELGRLLAEVDSIRISGYERAVLVAAHRRMVSYHQAEGYRQIGLLYEDCVELSIQPEEGMWAATTELSALLHLSGRAAELELGRALSLLRLPRVLSALRKGALDLYRAETIVAHTCHLREEDARWVSDQVLSEAPGLTASQIRVRTQRLCYLASPEEARLRYGEAVKNRHVEVKGNEFGTATLRGHDLPPDRAEAAYKRLTRLARKLKRQGEERTMDQLRADLLLELLLGEAGNQGKQGNGGSVDLRVDLETLAGLSEAPGELGGFGPVISDIARQVAREQAHCPWSFAVTDPETGMPIHTGVTRRRPRRETRRLVEARNPSCIFPGCRRPSRDCDLDHRIPWSERGPTCDCNLVPLCRRHHLCRHRLGWRHQPLPRSDHLWISPLGHRYTTSGRPP
ncbi:MAG TPA: DUF222 domain-containing protein, partial [Acidimicrobiia bacterium]|nr:DUF222 domain-containing protein [Acidimicrobiia bacterium]